MQKKNSNGKKPKKPRNDNIFDGKSVGDVYKYVHESLLRESDRGTVLLSGVFVEAILGSMLNKKLIPVPNKSSISISFSSKIDLAYQVALIDQETFNLFHFLREARNTFAHHITSTINDEYITEVLNKLFNSKKLIHSNLKKIRMKNPNTPEPAKRTQFDDLMTVVISLLYEKSLTIEPITGASEL